MFSVLSAILFKKSFLLNYLNLLVKTECYYKTSEKKNTVTLTCKGLQQIVRTNISQNDSYHLFINL